MVGWVGYGQLLALEKGITVDEHSVALGHESAKPFVSLGLKA